MSKNKKEFSEEDVLPKLYPQYFSQSVIFPSFAAIIEKCLLHPLDTIITLQQSSWNTRTIWTVTNELLQQPLKHGFYKGFSIPILLGSIPLQVSQYGSYNFAKTYFTDQGYYLPHAMGLACITSTFLTTTILTPIEAKRTRDTLNIKVPIEYSYKIQNIYRGGSAVFLKGCFHMPISLMGTEILQKYINPDSGLAFLFSGIITGAFTQIFTTPLDVLKTKMMQDVYAEKNIFQHVNDILHYGNPFHSLFARSVRMGLSTGIIFSSMHFAEIILNKISEYSNQSSNIDYKERNKKLNIKDFKHADKEESELRGISNSNTKTGLSKLEIENNLKILQQLAEQKKEFYVEESITEVVSLKTRVQEWYQKKDSNYYGSIVALYTNDQSVGHAVLVYAEKVFFGIKIRIIDPMSVHDSIYTEQIKLLLQNLQITLLPAHYISTDIIYSGKQNAEYAICGDISLIMLQELIESGYVDIKYDIFYKGLISTEVFKFKFLLFKYEYLECGNHNKKNTDEDNFLSKTIDEIQRINYVLSNNELDFNVDDEEKFKAFINEFFLQTQLRIEEDLLIGNNLESWD